MGRARGGDLGVWAGLDVDVCVCHLKDSDLSRSLVGGYWKVYAECIMMYVFLKFTLEGHLGDLVG